MKPTPELRFIERTVQIPVQGDFAVTYKTIRILQQWWEVEYVAKDLHNNVADGEWRDVPLEKE